MELNYSPYRTSVTIEFNSPSLEKSEQVIKQLSQILQQSEELRAVEVHSSTHENDLEGKGLELLEDLNIKVKPLRTKQELKEAKSFVFIPKPSEKIKL